MTYCIRTESERETVLLGQRLGRLLERGDVLLINGELGAGKTAMIRGLTAGAGGSAADVRSPSYTYLNEYEAERFPIFHLDVYLLESYDDLLEIGLEDLWERGIILIEWGGRFAADMPQPCWRIDFEYLSGNARSIVITPPAHRAAAFEEVSASWPS